MAEPPEGLGQLARHMQGAADPPPALMRSIDGFLAAFAQLDWDVFRGYFLDDAQVFFPVAQKPYRADGRQAVEAIFCEVFALARRGKTGPPYLDLQPHDLRLDVTGDLAIVTFHLYDPGVLCRRTLVWRATADGWKIQHLHASNMPLPYDANHR